jgi:hypothetical protein
MHSGGTVARAKRTDRAAARRRHRASFADPLDEGTPDPTAGDAVADGTPARPAPADRARAVAGGSTPPVRPSITAAFRSSFRPLDVRGDIRALPQILRHWSLWVPIILAGLSVALVPFMGPASIAGVLFGYFSGGAPFGTAFVAGLFAPRASYLVGALAALASLGFLALAFAVGPFGGSLDGAVDPVTKQPISVAAMKTLLLNEALTAGVPLAAIVASAGAWYRRFLNNANPNRRRPAAPTSRRPDGKVPKKPAQRPMLARRR